MSYDVNGNLDQAIASSRQLTELKQHIRATLKKLTQKSATLDFKDQKAYKDCLLDLKEELWEKL